MVTTEILDYKKTQTSYSFISVSSNDGINNITRSFTINVNDINDTSGDTTTWYVSSGQFNSPYF